VSIKTTLTGSILLVIGLLISFNYVYRHLTVPWIQFLFQADFISILEQSQNDQKQLAVLDPENEAAYRKQYGVIQDLKSHLQVLEHNQKNLQNTLNRVYLIVLAVIFSLAITAYLLHQNYVKQNLYTLRLLIEQLLDNQIPSGPQVKGVFKKMELMIRDATAILMQKNRKIKTLDHLTQWQESARRHAHEIKTPLTASRLELERLEHVLLPHLSEEAMAVWEKGKVNIINDLDRLKEFTTGFSSFGKINKPKLKKMDLAETICDFVEIYQHAWPNLKLSVSCPETPVWIQADKDLLRQSWMNLVQNSAQAQESKHNGMATFTLKVEEGLAVLNYKDNGPGVSAEIAPRIFEPYVTSKDIGKGMGLGMAISKKIFLDHQGDLEFDKSQNGASFQMTLPVSPSGEKTC